MEIDGPKKGTEWDRPGRLKQLALFGKEYQLERVV